MRVSGDKAGIVSCYAPHSGHALADRSQFFETLGTVCTRMSLHGPMCVAGNFNAKLYRRRCDDHCMGPGVFSNPDSAVPQDCNRHFLVELCAHLGVAIANTLTDDSVEHLVTCYNVGSRPQDAVTWQSHLQIDSILLRTAWLPKIMKVHSNRDLVLASHHFPELLHLDVSIPKLKRSRQLRVEWSLLQ